MNSYKIIYKHSNEVQLHKCTARVSCERHVLLFLSKRRVDHFHNRCQQLIIAFLVEGASPFSPKAELSALLSAVILQGSVSGGARGSHGPPGVCAQSA